MRIYNLTRWGTVLTITELLGVSTLVLVLLAASSIPGGIPSQLRHMQEAIYLVLVCTLPMSILSGLWHILEILGARVVYIFHPITDARPWYGLLLVILGGAIFWGSPGYFHALATSTNLSFWQQVSAYSLPAICVEGGLLTLYCTLLNQQPLLSRTYKAALATGFLFWTAVAVAGNFLALLGLWGWTVDMQIATTRVVVIVTIVIAAIVYWHNLVQTSAHD